MSLPDLFKINFNPAMIARSPVRRIIERPHAHPV